MTNEELEREYDIELRKLYNSGELDKAMYVKSHKSEFIERLAKKYSVSFT